MRGESAGVVEVIVATVLTALLIGVCGVVAEAQKGLSVEEADRRNAGDLFTELQIIAADDSKKKKLKSDGFKDKVGRGFFEVCFRKKVLESHLLRKCVSLHSDAGDSASNDEFIEDEAQSFPQSACSLATPKAQDLLVNLTKRGKNKTIVLCWDSRNWNNCRDSGGGVLVSWSDGEEAAYLSPVDAEKEHGIARADFYQPDAKLLGVKAPFNNVFEEEASAKITREARDAAKDLPSFAGVCKKGHKCRYEGKNTGKGFMPAEYGIVFEVVDVVDQMATVTFDITDKDGKSLLPTGAQKKTYDLQNPKAGRPGGKLTVDGEEEIETAGRKWKCTRLKQIDGDSTSTLWYSKDIPGLLIKGSSEATGEAILVEFTEPK